MNTAYETPTSISSSPGELTWEVARLFPTQGNWSEFDFLHLPTPHRFELSQGRLETLPMPTWLHARICFLLAMALEEFVRPRKLGLVALAPLYVRLWEGEIRQPDVVFCFSENIHDRRKIQNGADLAIEIVSEGKENRDRDVVIKKKLYAEAGIREYWIVDPQERSITVLSLEGASYRTAGEYKPGDQAASVLLPGFTVDVTAAVAAGEA